MVNPLDFETIISYAIGDATIFFFVAAIALSVLAAKWRIPITAYFMMMFIFMLIMFFSLGLEVVLLIVIIIGIITGYILTKIVK